MIGRGSYGRPWFLQQVIHYLRDGRDAAPIRRCEQQHAVVREHYDAMLSHYGIAAGLRIARKHIGWYSKGLPGSAEFRAAFNRIDEPEAAKAAIDAFYRPLVERLAA